MKKVKFTCHVTINAPLTKVVELWDNPDNLQKWQDGFVSMEQLSGEPGVPGAKSKMVYQIGKRQIDLIETIKVKNLPDEFTAVYEAESMTNTMTNQFKAVGENETQFDSTIEYIQFNGFLPKMMAVLMPGVFQKQTQKWMNQFKVFVENVA